EQAQARPGEVDHRSDVYSLGVTLYELLTGVPAVRGSEPQEVLLRIGNEEPRPPRRLDRTIPADLETIVLKAIAKVREERYQTAQELADDLRRFLDDKPIRARRPTLWQQLVRWVRRHRAVMRAVTAVVLVMLAVLSAVLFERNTQIEKEKQATEE